MSIDRRAETKPQFDGFVGRQHRAKPINRAVFERTHRATRCEKFLAFLTALFTHTRAHACLFVIAEDRA